MPTKLTEAQRQTLKQFREQHADPDGTLKKYVADFRQERKQISGVLKKGPATVPELAQHTDMPTDQVLWHVTAMKKYGTVRELGPDGDYVKYEFVDENSK